VRNIKPKSIEGVICIARCPKGEKVVGLVGFGDMVFCATTKGVYYFSTRGPDPRHYKLNSIFAKSFKRVLADSIKKGYLP
jgi:hypothetical protein